MKTFKEIRTALGLTKKDVCEGAEISYFNLNNIENCNLEGTKAAVVSDLMKFYRQNYKVNTSEIAL